MSISLTQSALANLPKGVATPDYDRQQITGGILHIGVGNFHRAHMAVYIDDLFKLGHGFEWGIIGAGIRPTDETMRERLLQQDWLTTVVELDPSGLSARVTGSMIDFAPVNPDAIIKATSAQNIKIVSLTVTEGGYYLDEASGGFQSKHPDIIADAKTPEQPRTVFGIIIKAIKCRQALGIEPFTVLSCDNLPGNGHVAQRTIVGLAGLSDPDFARWIEQNICFPNSMVDCITPATTERERALVENTFGIKDSAPVVCEPFHQWIIEDNFSSGRPPLEKVGVDFVDDVSKYELMKIRILNAGHAIIAYAAALLGHHFVHDAMADEDIKNWLFTLQLREIIPTLAPIQGVDYTDYLVKTVTRFENPEIGDTITRLTAEGADRQPKFILPTLRDALARNSPIDGLALEVALWCLYCQSKAQDGQEITLQDQQADKLHTLAIEAAKRPAAFLENANVFGDLIDNAQFCDAFTLWLTLLQQDGVRETLRSYNSQ